MPAINERAFAQARKGDAAKLVRVQKQQAVAAQGEDLRRGYRSVGSPAPAVAPSVGLSDEDIEARRRARQSSMFNAARGK